MSHGTYITSKGIGLPTYSKPGTHAHCTYTLDMDNKEPVSVGLLDSAQRNATSIWKDNLIKLLQHADVTFGDVLWELPASYVHLEVSKTEDTRFIYGHKALIYARCSPEFRDKYLASTRTYDDWSDDESSMTLSFVSDGDSGYFRPPLVTQWPSARQIREHIRREEEELYSEIHGGGYTSPGTSISMRRVSTDTWPFESESKYPLRSNILQLQLTSSANVTLLREHLRYMYTGSGQLFQLDSEDPEPDDVRLSLEKMREDLVYMWRTDLYCDMRIAVPAINMKDDEGEENKTNEQTLAVFNVHRFMLAGRSSYWADILQANAASPDDISSPYFSLPFPPFSPACTHFILGFIYTGELTFSSQTFDLLTAFHIFDGAGYLSMVTLQTLIIAHIIEVMLHGLFHASMPLEEYNLLTRHYKDWGAVTRLGGCQCRKCIHRAPRVLQFSLSANDLTDFPEVERGARRALVAMFGQGWCTKEFAALLPEIVASIISDFRRAVSPSTVLSLIFSAETGINKLDQANVRYRPWTETVRSILVEERKYLDGLLVKDPMGSFESEEWKDVVHTNDSVRLNWIMESIVRSGSTSSVSSIYQVLLAQFNTPALQSNPSLRYRIMLAKDKILHRITLSSPTEVYVRTDQHIYGLLDHVNGFLLRQTPASSVGSRTNSFSNSRTSISGSSQFSYISEQTVPNSIPGSWTRGVQLTNLYALDLASQSMYSYASSRTISTDYGYFYIRRAYSQEWSEISSLRRAHSFDSFSVREG